MTTPRSPVTRLLAAVGRGEPSAHDKLWDLVYHELHAMARQQVTNEPSGRRRQPTSLVHEAYLRLTAGEQVEWANRRHFFAAAAQAMRRIRTDDARKRNRLKRGGGADPGPLPETAAVFDQDPAELLSLDEALGKLEREEPEKAEVVLLRYFAELSIDECAEVLEVSSRTVDKWWRFARAWLYREMSGE